MTNLRNKDDLYTCLKKVQNSKDARKLSIGHLTANADFDTMPERAATFYFWNVAPQWQITNGGNYKLVEIITRNIVSDYKRPLDVYTGTHGNDAVLSDKLL